MKERPILFSGSMVCAILDGQKTQTRRIVKFAQIPAMTSQRELHRIYKTAFGTDDGGFGWVDCNPEPKYLRKLANAPGKQCPYGRAGDRLWVRETWGCFDADSTQRGICYKSDGEDGAATWLDIPQTEWYAEEFCKPDEKWHPSIHMPRWASRITLEITEVRVERLQSISENDAWEEGIDEKEVLKIPSSEAASAVYSALWEKINGKGSWNDNPWVWVVCFRRVETAD